MSMSRYTNAPIFGFGAQYGTSITVPLIRRAVHSGALATKPLILRGAERLDTMAGKLFGDSKYWWVLAATSNIGWGLQVPPGTILNVPDIKDVLKLIG